MGRATRASLRAWLGGLRRAVGLAGSDRAQDAVLCIAAEEPQRLLGLPHGLLAIVLAKAGRHGRLRPKAVTVGRKDHWLAAWAEVATFGRAARAQGRASSDVGCTTVSGHGETVAAVVVPPADAPHAAGRPTILRAKAGIRPEVACSALPLKRAARRLIACGKHRAAAWVGPLGGHGNGKGPGEGWAMALAPIRPSGPPRVGPSVLWRAGSARLGSLGG